MIGIHPVSSKEHMLQPTDIFLVAANEYKQGLEMCKAAAKKANITPERLLYTIMLKEYSDPRLLRVRAGNTLFTIAALPERTGFVRGYNGDTGENYVNNIIEFIQSARKMGFDKLFAHTSSEATKALKLALKKGKFEGVTSNYNSASQIFTFTTGEPRGE
jgi:hypothetical protein